MRFSLPPNLLLGLQVSDITVHLLTGQVEPIRIASNLVIVVGAVAATGATSFSGVLPWLAGFVYLVLNLLFLAQHGITNPTTEALRIPLFGFVAISLILLIWQARTTARKGG